MKSKENKLERWKSEQIKKNSSGGSGHKKKKLGKKIKIVRECCLFLLIIACDEMWRMNRKEIEFLCLLCNGKISYALNYEHCDFVGNYGTFM